MLLPTFSYLAYANEHASWERPIKASVGGAGSLAVTERDRYMSQHRLLSLYELHADGSGTCLSSWRRPVLNMRPGYHLPLVKGPHQFSADLELLYWLEQRGVDFDVITDDDLHRQGAAALDRYRVVLTGSHPEYVSRQMLDGLDSYLSAGGRLMYLGGNGFYWVTTAPGDDPFVIEVRRGMAGTRVWESPPGEWHQAMTGEHGGLWRQRGRPPQALTGIGFTAQGFDRSLPYRIDADAIDERSKFIVEGIDTDAPLGGTGSVLGGPAGFEIDRVIPPSARRSIPCWSRPPTGSATPTKARWRISRRRTPSRAAPSANWSGPTWFSSRPEPGARCSPSARSPGAGRCATPDGRPRSGG